MKIKNKNKILVITPKYPKSYSGASIQNHKINLLLANKYDFEILTRDDSKNSDFEGIKINRIKSTKSKFQFLNNLKWLLGSSFFILKNKNLFNIIHILGCDSLEVSLMPLIKFLKKPIVIKRAIAGEISGTFLKRLKSKIIKYTASKIISISEEISHELESLRIKKKIVKIPNGVYIKNAKNFTPLVPTFSIIGIIRKRKGLFEGVQFLINNNPFKKYKLLIAGPIYDNHYWSKVQLLLKNYNINYKYLSNLPNHQIQELLNESSFLISMSKKEGLPNIVLEALSNGVPVICSNISPHREIILNKVNGFIIEKNKKNDFLNFKYEKKYLDLSINAINSVKKFDIIKVKNNYDLLYSSLLKD